MDRHLFSQIQFLVPFQESHKPDSVPGHILVDRRHLYFCGFGLWGRRFYRRMPTLLYHGVSLVLFPEESQTWFNIFSSAMWAGSSHDFDLQNGVAVEDVGYHHRLAE